VQGSGGDRVRQVRTLGRGLSEVSHVFLSGAQRSGQDRPEKIAARRFDATPAADLEPERDLWSPKSSLISITSGGRVRGKTLLTVNLAYRLLTEGRKVAVVNADPERPDVFDAMGCARPRPGESAEDPVDAGANDAMVAGDHFAGIVAVDALARPGRVGCATLDALETAARRGHVVLVDTSAWDGEPGRTVWGKAGLVIVLAEPGSERMQASYATVKRVHAAAPSARIGLVLNRVRSYAEGEDCFRKLAEVSRKFLKINLRNHGCVLFDAVAAEAYQRAIPLAKAFPGSKATGCVDAILGLIMMDESAIARRRREVTFEECALRKGRLQALKSSAF
jgi:flagellar biosynthesis protein FlhG